ncbi:MULTISPECIES: DUF6316 family protein [Marinobacter]|uniref:DUF6316 family protein n=1 Tax=Marinobacter TaxID=2742 RepID=UPI000DAD6AFD|nr:MULTISPECIES: DUF6316 family protein [Marinobacter]
MFLQKRQGERGPLPPRSSRFFAVGRRWYFATREKRSLGPFESFEQAQVAAYSYIQDKDAQRRGADVNYTYGLVLHDYETCTAAHCQRCREMARMLA